MRLNTYISLNKIVYFGFITFPCQNSTSIGQTQCLDFLQAFFNKIIRELHNLPGNFVITVTFNKKAFLYCCSSQDVSKIEYVSRKFYFWFFNFGNHVVFFFVNAFFNGKTENQILMKRMLMRVWFFIRKGFVNVCVRFWVYHDFANECFSWYEGKFRRFHFNTMLTIFVVPLTMQ